MKRPIAIRITEKFIEILCDEDCWSLIIIAGLVGLMLVDLLKSIHY